jgi:heat shock protein HslJ
MNLRKKTIVCSLIFALLIIGLLVACGPSGGSDDFKDANWKLLTIGGEPAIPGVTVTTLFDGTGGLTGFAGCNDYSGNYGVGANQLQINVIRNTTNVCDADIMAQEEAFLDALRLASSFDSRDNPDLATVMNTGGTALMTMERFTP